MFLRRSGSAGQGGSPDISSIPNRDQNLLQFRIVIPMVISIEEDRPVLKRRRQNLRAHSLLYGAVAVHRDATDPHLDLRNIALSYCQPDPKGTVPGPALFPSRPDPLPAARHTPGNSCDRGLMAPVNPPPKSENREGREGSVCVCCSSLPERKEHRMVKAGSSFRTGSRRQ